MRTITMDCFFGDVTAFRKTLKRKATPAWECWSCSARDQVLMPFDVADGFRLLRRRLPDCMWDINLCPRCGAAYLNSLDAALHKPEGPPRWNPRLVMGLSVGNGKDGLVRQL